jgi:hypothetical protein
MDARRSANQRPLPDYGFSGTTRNDQALIPDIKKRATEAAPSPRRYQASQTTPDTSNTMHEACQQKGRRLNVEARGFGVMPITRIAARLANRDGVVEPWYRSLDRADDAEGKEIANAIAEWADGDTVAAHNLLSNRLSLHWRPRGGQDFDF